MSLKIKFEVGPLDQPTLGGLRLCPTVDIAPYILTYDVILLSDSHSQTLFVAECAVNMWRWVKYTAVHCQLQYSNGFDTTATLRRMIEACF